MASTSQIRAWWEPACKGPFTTITLHGGGVVSVKTNIVDAVQALNKCLKVHNYVARKADTGAYNCRKITGGTGYSLHAYGIALDINWQSNPYGKQLITDMPRAMVAAIKGIRTNNGKQVWRWGGDYSNNKDAMHYEIIVSPADIATGINQNTVPGAQPQPQPEPPKEEETDMNYLFTIHPDRANELPPQMRDAASSGAWFYTDGKEFWWCPTTGHADKQHQMKLASSNRPTYESPSFLKELKPRSLADLNPNQVLLSSGGDKRNYFFDAEGNVSSVVK